MIFLALVREGQLGQVVVAELHSAVSGQHFVNLLRRSQSTVERIHHGEQGCMISARVQCIPKH